MALATQTMIEQLLQQPFGDEALADQLIAWADASVIAYIGFNPESADALTENHDPTGTDQLWVDRPPIRSVTSVTVDGSALTDSVTAGYKWYPSGLLLRTGTVWSAYPQGVEVVYNGGYASIPPDLSLVSAAIAARRFQAGVAALPEDGALAGVQSISLSGSDSIAFTATANDFAAGGLMTEEERATLDYYRRGTVGV